MTKPISIGFTNYPRTLAVAIPYVTGGTIPPLLCTEVTDGKPRHFVRKSNLRPGELPAPYMHTFLRTGLGDIALKNLFPPAMGRR